MTAKVNNKVWMFRYYVLNSAMSDTNGPATAAADRYDLRLDYGRAPLISGTEDSLAPTRCCRFTFRIAPFIYLQSGLPYPQWWAERRWHNPVWLAWWEAWPRLSLTS